MTGRPTRGGLPAPGSRAGRWLTLVGFVLLGTSCGDAPSVRESDPAPDPAASSSTGSGQTVSPRADAAVISSSAPEWGEGGGAAWELGGAPLLTLGAGLHGSGDELFGVYSAALDGDSILLIGNAGTSELRIFDLRSRAYRTIGRAGAGPGEFGSASYMKVCPLPSGRVLVSDEHNGRVHVFDGDTVVRQHRLRGVMTMEGCFPDGSLLTHSVSGTLRGAPGEVLPSTATFGVIHDDGAWTPLLEVPGRPRFVNELDGVTHYPFMPLTVDPVAAVDRNGTVWIGTGAEPELRKVDVAGNVREVVRWQRPGTRTNDEILPVLKRYATETIRDPNQRRLYAHLFDQELPLPADPPAYSRLMVDDLGYVWTERFWIPGSENAADVFSPSGTWLGSLGIPEGLRILDVGSALLVGRRLDENGVELLDVHRIGNRGGPPRNAARE